LELASGSFRIFKEVLSILIFYSLSFPPDTEMEQKLLLFSLVFIGNSLLKQKISPGRNEVLPGLV